MMCLTFGAPAANSMCWILAGCRSGRLFGVVRRAMGCRHPKSANQRTREAAMTTVSVVTAQPGTPTASNGSSTIGLRLARRSGRTDSPTGAYDGHTGGPSGGRGCRSASVASAAATPATASGATTSTSANKGGPGTPCRSQGRPSQTHRGTQGRGGGPVERESHGNLGNTIAQLRADLARVSRK